IEGLIDNAILIKLSNLFLEISNIGNQSIVEEFLEEVSTKIQTIKLIGQDIEQKAVSNSNKNNEYDPGTKSVTNKYTRIDSLLYEYATGNKSVIEEIYKTLKQENKAAIVMEVYLEITDEIDHIKLNTEEDVLELKRKLLTQARDKVIKDFSKAWFVSKDELDLSAIQYVAGANSIPNIGGIINSKDYDSYKTKNLEANPIKYAQAMKQDWHKALDEKIAWLNDELRRVEK
ncbi:type I restriction-modification system restriction subunit, partial [Bacillus sp. FW1]